MLYLSVLYVKIQSYVFSFLYTIALTWYSHTTYMVRGPFVFY